MSWPTTRVYVTSGSEGAGWFRCDKHGIPRVTKRKASAECFTDARAAGSVLPLLANIGWTGEVRDER